MSAGLQPALATVLQAAPANRSSGASAQASRRRSDSPGYLRGYVAGTGFTGARRASRFRVR